MFDISWLELLTIGLVAIAVIKPEDMPEIIRTFRNYFRKFRDFVSECKDVFDEALGEVEPANIKRQILDLEGNIQETFTLDDIPEDSLLKKANHKKRRKTKVKK